MVGQVKCTLLELQIDCYMCNLMLHPLTVGEGEAQETDPECEAVNGHCSKSDLNDLQNFTNLLVTGLITT